MPRFNPLLPIQTLPSFKYVLTTQASPLGQAIVNTFYFLGRVGSTSTPSVATMHAALNAVMLPAISSVISSRATIVQSTCVRFDDPTTPVSVIEHSTVGGVAGDRTPAFNCFRIKRFTAFGGQRGRGMVRIGPVAESSQTEDKVADAFVPVLDALCDVLQAPVATANPTDGLYDPALLTRTFSLPPVVAVQVRGAPVIDWFPSLIIGSQRTRLPRIPN